MKRQRPKVDPNETRQQQPRVDPNASNQRKQIDALAIPDDVWRTTIDRLRPWELIWLARTCHRMLRLCGPGTLAWKTATMRQYTERLRPMLPHRWIDLSPYFAWSAALDSFDVASKAADEDSPTNCCNRRLPFRTRDWGSFEGIGRRRKVSPAEAALDDALTMHSRVHTAGIAMINLADSCANHGCDRELEPSERCCRACSAKLGIGDTVDEWTAVRYYRRREPRAYQACVFVSGSTHTVGLTWIVEFPVGHVHPSIVAEAFEDAMEWHRVPRPPYRRGKDRWQNLQPLMNGKRVTMEEWNKFNES